MLSLASDTCDQRTAISTSSSSSALLEFCFINRQKGLESLLCLLCWRAKRLEFLLVSSNSRESLWVSKAWARLPVLALLLLNSLRPLWNFGGCPVS